jgi:uncharacterized protein YueI
LGWGQSRPNNSRKLINRNEFITSLESETTPILLIVASQSLVDLEETKTWLQEVENDSNFHISSSFQTKEPYLTYIEFYLVSRVKT